MSAQEATASRDEVRTVTCATLGPSGWPRLMPLWYVLRESGPDEPAPRLWAWTYGVSQKVRNLERGPRATLQVEAGESYEELRGVMLECEVVVHKELDVVKALGREIFARHAATRGAPAVTEFPPEGTAMVAGQAAKHVALDF